VVSEWYQYRPPSTLYGQGNEGSETCAYGFSLSM
jgi:hypothetical protein